MNNIREQRALNKRTREGVARAIDPPTFRIYAR